MLQFKKIITFCVTLSLLSKVACCQDNRITLRVNYLFSFRDKGSINDTTPKYNNNAFQILPSVGYYHTFKNNIGIGIEFGYRNSTYTERSTYNIEGTSHVLNSTHQILYQSYFICPSVYETFTFKKYLANLAFTIPVEYINKLATYSDFYQMDNQTNTSTQSIEYKRWPRIIQYALYIQGGFYRKIYKGIYLGAELAIGPSFESRFGKGEGGYHKDFNNGILVQEKTITYSSDHYTQVRLVSLPTLSILYRFTKK